MSQPPFYTFPPEGGLRRRAYLGAALARGHAGPPRVSRLVAGGSAEAAGVLLDDVITGVREFALQDAAALTRAMASFRSGDVVPFQLLRAGQPMTLQVPLCPLPVEKLQHGTTQLAEVTGPSGRLRGIFARPLQPSRACVYYLQTSDWGSCEHPLHPRHPETRFVDALCQLGIASFRLERSGTGDSEGVSAMTLGLQREVACYEAGWQWLERHMKAMPLAIVGNSLGGMMAPLIHAQPLAIAVVGTSAAGWHQCTLDSYERRGLREAGQDAEAAAAFREAFAKLTQLQQQVFCEGLTPAQVYAHAPELRGLFPWLVDDRAYGRTVRFFQQLQATDLLAHWRDCRSPLLVMHGHEDWICTEAEGRQICVAVNGAGGRADYLDVPLVDHSWHAQDAPVIVARALADWLAGLIPTSVRPRS